MGKILDGFLFAGPVLAVVLGLLFAFASSNRIFARRPRQLALGVAIPMLVAVVGALRLRPVECDTSVLLAVIGIALAACAVGFAAALGLGLLLRMSSRAMTKRGGRRHDVEASGSGFLWRRTRRKGLPAGPRIRQDK